MGWIIGMVAWATATTAHADPCKPLGVGKDPGSSIAVTTMVRHLAGSPPTRLSLELRGDGAFLSAAAPSGIKAARGEPALLVFEGGTRASWMPSEDTGKSWWEFPLDGPQLEQLKDGTLVTIALPLPEGDAFDLVLDKDNQKTVQAGARCILSRTAP